MIGCLTLTEYIARTALRLEALEVAWHRAVYTSEQIEGWLPGAIERLCQKIELMEGYALGLNPWPHHLDRSGLALRPERM